ncbi:MAG: glycosyltransferase [Bacteroidetes bacterium]|nr:glycosyltransferase [Bacteroidota bacterium]
MIVVTIGIVLCIGAVVYCYVLYPPMIRRIAARGVRPIATDRTDEPAVSVILSVHNEERVIVSCLDSLLALDYPKDRFQILVGSDGSRDATNEILQRYSQSHSSVKAFYFPEQRGKIAVLNDLVRHATTPILFFTDADIRLATDVLRLQTRHYSDEHIGAVAGMNDIYSPESSSVYDSEKGYTDKEQMIRTAESMYYSTVGLSGANYSLRRRLWVPLPDGLIHDDFFVVLSVLRQGYRIVSEARSVSSDLFARTLRDEFRRKVRSASRGFHTLSYFPELLLPRGGRAALLLWSHKLLRWLTPTLAVASIVFASIGVALSGSMWCLAVVAAGAGLSAICALGLILNSLNVRVPILDQLSWFFAMNVAYLWGTILFITHSDQVIWKPATRADAATINGVSGH